MNTEHLHLFTKVEDGLPDKEGEYLCILANNKVIVLHFGDDNMFKLVQSAFYKVHPTHYLDLSKLTTIERAVEFARDALNARILYHFGTVPIHEHGIENYIQQNKNKL